MTKVSEKDMQTARKYNLFNVFKLKKFVAVFNKLCRRCKGIATQQPRELYDNSCSLCKPKLKRLAEKVK